MMVINMHVVNMLVVRMLVINMMAINMLVIYSCIELLSQVRIPSFPAPPCGTVGLPRLDGLGRPLRAIVGALGGHIHAAHTVTVVHRAFYIGGLQRSAVSPWQRASAPLTAPGPTTRRMRRHCAVVHGREAARAVDPPHAPRHDLEH